MKHVLLIFIATLFSMVSVAQQSINYKALIKDDNGDVIVNQPVTIQFQILEAGATNVYQETHIITTNAQGIIVVNIGEGNVNSGNYLTINWGANDHFLNVQVDTGDGLVDLGTTQFMSVPYANFAEDTRKGTLNDAYNKGGPGSGRAINAIDGRVVIKGDGLAVRTATNEPTLFVDGQDNSVGIGTFAPQGALDIVSNNDTGVVIPRVSSIKNVTDGQGNLPANGTLVFDVSKNTLCFFFNEKWACMGFNDNGTIALADSTPYYQSQDTYIKASNTEENDGFGASVVLSADGNTLAVAASLENSNATGINGDQTNNNAQASGAVYVFYKSGGSWAQQAYIKASNTQAGDQFGSKISISNDGNTLVVGTIDESSNATGINGNQADNSADRAGAAYVFIRTGTTWSQQAYIKASNTEENDFFGNSVSVSGDGNTLAISAINEDSNATGVNGDQNNNNGSNGGATYIFSRTGTTWSQEAYLKPSTYVHQHYFGTSVALSNDGNTVAIGATGDNSNATGVNGDETNTAASSSGATYVFTRTGSTWSQQAYIKASNTGGNDEFGYSLDLAGDGNTLVIGALREDSNSSGVNGDESNNSYESAGATYVYTRAGSTWSQEAYLKASNPFFNYLFGFKATISNDGGTILISTPTEAGSSTGINGTIQGDNLTNAGACYVFSKTNTTWSQIAYVKATNTDAEDAFGFSSSISGDGEIIVSGAPIEASNATGINGDQTNNSTSTAGAVYIYEN